MRLLHRRPFSTGNASFNTRKAYTCTHSSTSQHIARHQHVLQLKDNGTNVSPVTVSARLRPIAASPAASTPSGQPQPIVVELPESQQAAAEAAAQCLVPALQPLLVAAKPARTAKGFSGARGSSNNGNRFGVEIPVLDTSPQAVQDLTTLLINLTAAKLKQRGGGGSGGAPAWTVVHARDDVLQLARSRGGGSSGAAVGVGQVLGLRQACQQPQLGGLLLVVEPSVSDVALVEQLLDEVWVGTAAVVLNPGWSQQGATVPPEYERLLDTISVLYSFLPCAIQGLLGRKEGAVLRAVEPGVPPGRAAWRILLQEKDKFVQVGAMGRRPTSSDLELAFLNASAAASPLTKTAKFLRGLIPGDKNKK